MKVHWFLPFVYLPDVADNKLKTECEKVLDELLDGTIVTDADLFDISVSIQAEYKNLNN